MEFIDISVPISPEMVVWPGAPKTELAFRRSMERGDKSNNSNLFMNCHSGTHIDAPLHFIREGTSVEQISLKALIGPAHVLDLTNQFEINARNLESSWPTKKVERILLKTSNSRLWTQNKTSFVENYCALTEGGARWLLKNTVFLIGIDYLSIQRFGDSPIVHQLLLENNIAVLEGLDLSKVAAGEYELLCLPLKLVGVEGAPARVVLRSL